MPHLYLLQLLSMLFIIVVVSVLYVVCVVHASVCVLDYVLEHMPQARAELSHWPPYCLETGQKLVLTRLADQ